MFGDKKNSKTAPKGIDRRAFERHPLDLDATISVPGSAAIHRKIKDFCVGGMLLVDDEHTQRAGLATTYELAEDDLIGINFTIAANDGSSSRSCSLNGRIVRQDLDSSGVALVEPDLSVIQSLMELAKSFRQSQAEVTPLGISHPANTDLIAECTEIVVTCLTPLATKTHKTIVDSLFEQSKTLKDIAEQNMYFETLGILNDNQEKFISSFYENAIEQMAQCQNGQLPQHDVNADALSMEVSELAIVEEEALDNWLADTGTIESVQRTHIELLTQLVRRLSELFSTQVDHENNPYGPKLFTNAFQEALSSFGLNHKVALVCHKVFKTLLTTVLGELYNKINTHLVDKGILPDLKYNIPHAANKPESDVQPVQVQETENDVDDIAVTDSQSSKSQSQNNQVSDSQPENARTATSQIENPQAGAVEDRSPPPVDDKSNQNIYELVAELRTLKRQLRDQSSGAPGVVESPGDAGVASAAGVTGKAGEAAVSGVPLSPGEVLNTLRRIESNCTDLNRDEIKKLVYDSLSGEVDENGEAKIVAPRENRIIDVSNSIFDTMLTDVQVPENMHGWLARMEMPVLKMAIEDDSLFQDRDHLVRQVVNKIAQLGLLIGEEESEGASGVRSALDWLVNLINTEFDGTLSVFDRVSNQLDLLIKAQDRKYEEQLKVVINDVEAEVSHDEVAPNLEAEFESEHDYEEWLRRANRLEEGDWILFDVGTPENKRLRAAWIARHTGKVVFVDALGSKDRVIFLEELAALLHSGSAITLDDANEPAMDRAQYSMLQELNEQLVHESTHDQLTGLINRREFEKEIGKALISSRHSDLKHALLFVDLDQFNVINTTYGYEAGDLMLVEISELFSQGHGHESILARLGSDEFGLLIQDVNLEESLEIAEEFIHIVKEHKFMWEGKRISTGTSIGLVTLNNQSESITSLMQAAESSCGLAKEMGGNRMQLYRSGQSRLSHRSEVINWVSKIDEVLDEDRLKLRCQKIQPVDRNSAEKPHYEVLLVMVDENGDSVSIQDFIEAAEWSNRIHDIDRWVIQQALAWISENQAILETVGSFSINLSGRSLSDERLVDFIIEEIESSGVSPEALCFEITETIGVESLSDSADFINRIKTTGCHFSLDDFGSGMSSYAYLKNLPVDYLKIDGSFVKDMKSSISDYAVVKSICEIGHFMGKRVIAEYAEDEETIGMLTEIGVDFIQGFGVEKPLMINELLAPH